MEKQNLIKWCEALESGEYRQGREVLYEKLIDGRTELYCCLGVACKVLFDADEEKLEGHIQYPEDIDIDLDLPIITLEMLDGSADGLELELAPKLFHKLHKGTLKAEELFSHMNDRLNWSFSTIAKWIRDNLMEKAV